MSIGASKSQILVVDDEELIRNVFKMILKAKLPDTQTHMAVNGEEAVKLFKKHQPAAIVMDIHMPVKNGIQAYEEITEICAEKDWEIPAVIFCTGYQPPESLNNIITDTSPHSIVTKPVLAETLVKIIKKALQ